MSFPVPQAPTVVLIRPTIPEAKSKVVNVDEEIVKLEKQLSTDSVETVDTVGFNQEPVKNLPAPHAAETAKKIAISLINSAEAFLNLPVSTSGSAGHRLAKLTETISKDADRKQLLLVFTQAMSSSVPERKGNPKAGHTNLFNDVVRYVMACFFSGAAQRSHSFQRRQHWVPLTYLKSFPMNVSKIHQPSSTKKREAFVESVTYTDDGLLLETIHDENFVHPWSNNMKQDQLFFDPTIESAFSYVENIYAHNFIKDSKTSRRDAGLATFMAMQAVRMPSKKGRKMRNRFVNGSISSIVDNVLKNLDSLDGSLYVSVQDIVDRGPLGFTAEMPRACKQGDSITYLMPLSSTSMMFLSNQPLPPLKRKAVLRISMFGMYRHARRTKTRVYGATPVSIRKVIVERAFDTK